MLPRGRKKKEKAVVKKKGKRGVKLSAWKEHPFLHWEKRLPPPRKKNVAREKPDLSEKNASRLPPKKDFAAGLNRREPSSGRRGKAGGEKERNGPTSSEGKETLLSSFLSEKRRPPYGL